MAHLITIAREMGSLGDEIATAVSEKLQAPLLDREILFRAAALAGVSEASIQEAERVPSFLERMVATLGRYPVTWDVDMEGTTAPLVPPLSTNVYRLLIEEVIRAMAQSGSAVIVGHAGQVVLKDFPSVLRVLVCAPFEMRVERVMKQASVPRAEAEKRMREDDKTREDYFHSYYRVAWRDPHLYDLTLTTTRIDTEAGAEIIFDAGARLGYW
ncbi:MAG: cytidylate kinase-like family protein [Dehalococcoidia bacterium]|nr:cytidylate kinase-like family protein [Dehalococcoidia bacterium]